MPIPDFDAMNETDVREIIVRPLLHRLGFAHGTQDNIRTEVKLRYDRAFLGRKNPSKDPPLAGRADYICEVISYGRFTVEVKAPSSILTKDDAEQAHTYSAHPEIGAFHFLLTNGREFRLYVTSELDCPILTWRFENMDQKIVEIFNIIGPAAIRKRSERVRPMPGKPLGLGIGPRVDIAGGEVRYGEHLSDHPFLQLNGTLNGVVAGIRGGEVRRDDDGRLVAHVTLINPFQSITQLHRLAGLSDDYKFFSGDEFVSVELARPTIFQNVISGRLPPGQSASLFPGMPEMLIPFGFDCTVYTDAIGFIEGNKFKGMLSFEYRYVFIKGSATGNPKFDAMFDNSPREAKMAGEGEFSITISDP